MSNATATTPDATEQFLLLVLDGGLLFGLWMVFSFLKAIAERKGKRRWVTALDIAAWSCLWFAFSVSMVIYNKWLLDIWEGGLRFPLLISTIHMMLKYFFALVFVKCTSMSEKVPDIPSRIWWLSASPVGVSTGLDIAASNASYIYVTVTFYTIVKSSSLIFTLFFSVLYMLQPLSLSLTCSVFIIGVGVVLSSYGDTEFSWIGLGLVLGSAAVGGFRWSLTQVLMKQIKCDLNAILTVYLISPASAVALAPFALYLEGERFINSKFVSDPRLLVLCVLNIIGAGVFSFAMLVVELQLLQRTSSITLGVISYVKQILQILFSVMVFQDVLTPLNAVGFLVTVIGMSYYSYLKRHPPGHHALHGEYTNDGGFLFDDFDHEEFEDSLYSQYHQQQASQNGHYARIHSEQNRDHSSQSASLSLNRSNSFDSEESEQLDLS